MISDEKPPKTRDNLAWDPKSEGTYKRVYKLKVVLIGDIAVGKTNIMSRFIYNKYSKDYKCSVGVEFKAKTMSIDNDSVVELRLWDTCGCERFRAITTQFFRDANGVLLIYDVTKRETFNDLPKWLKDVQNAVDENAVVFLVGNKVDLEDERCVSSTEGVTFGKENNIDFAEVSAKTGLGVHGVFESLVRKMVLRQEENEVAQSEASSVLQKPKVDLNIKAKKGCCE